MEEWKEFKIEETSIEMIDGDRGKNYPKNNDFFTEGYCLFLNAGNVTKNGFSFSENSFITREKDDALRKGRLERNDVVITTRGTVGNVAVYDMKVPFEHIRINSGMLILKSGKDILPEYLYYYLKGNTFQTQISQYVSGSAQPQLPKGTLAKMSISFPQNKDIQKKIIAILKSFDDKIEVNRRINENLEQQAQALFKSGFVDFDPFKDQPFVESELGMIPQGWRVESLSSVADYINGLAMQKYRPVEGEKGLPVLKIKELGQGNIDDNSELCSPSLIGDKYIINDGDIIFSWSGTLMVKIWCGGKCGLNQHLFVVVPNSYPKWFVYQWTRFHLDNFIRIAKDKAVTMGHIKRGELDKAKVIIPDGLDLEKIGAMMKPIHQQIISHEIESRRLAELRDTLLPRLMSGEIKISDINS